MSEEKLQIINKIFKDETIRTIWDKTEEKYYISIVDIVGILSDSDNPRKYWNWLKNKLKKEENIETSSITRQLRLKAKDGKYRITDVCDIEGMFRIIESIPSKNAEPIKRWLAKLGKERIDEVFDPSLGIERAINLYRTKGYDEEWISKRIRILQERKKLTDVWYELGIEKEQEYAILTNEIYRSWSGMTASEYKEFKGLRKENLRDNMDNIELILSDLSEEATKRIALKNRPKGLKENIKVAHIGGNVAKVARKELEEKLGENIVNPFNRLYNNDIEKDFLGDDN